jgi:hypothetical protein
VLLEDFFDAPGAGGADALVDRKRLAQVPNGFAGFAVLEVDLAKSFEGACFDERGTDVAGDGEGLGVVAAGLLSGRGPGRQLTKAVENLGLAAPGSEVAG